MAGRREGVDKSPGQAGAAALESSHAAPKLDELVSLSLSHSVPLSLPPRFRAHSLPSPDGRRLVSRRPSLMRWFHRGGGGLSEFLRPGRDGRRGYVSPRSWGVGKPVPPGCHCWVPSSHFPRDPLLASGVGERGGGVGPGRSPSCCCGA
jgi:hypothetical protein